VVIVAKSIDHIKLQSRVKAFYDSRISQGASQDSPLLTTWDLDRYQLSSKGFSSGQALAERLRLYLRELKAKYPDLLLNPHSYGMHSLRRGGTVAAWEAGVDMEKLKAHGRWRSDAIQAYLTATVSIKLSITKVM
jgi:hypothetical protein